MGKINLKLDEVNDLNFEFKIQGASSEPNSGAVQFRFVIGEAGNPGGVSHIFPVTTKESNGTITVSVPGNTGLFKENVQYTGKVEVIIGTRLLVPTIMEIEFTRPLTVEVVQRIEPEIEEKIELDRVVAMVEGPIVNLKPSPSSLKPNKTGKSTVTLTKSQLTALIQERRQQQDSLSKESKFKDSLKSILKTALEE